ncbi:Deoxymugineic acid synthase 1 [Camellia lanceoleosa]|uniref:Deoxymugineic acid synthase 1 n=1 Tax=Camellia lanceoleosa TaxID=1840588 RepID=A0ACC0INF1_9ERIC|nr:Deoxymugineic acid synthase 1 [Camellia lanceoleosa]
MKVEMSPLWQQKKLREFCEKKGIHFTAYSPLGARGTLGGTNQVMDCEILKEIAEAKGRRKTAAQIPPYDWWSNPVSLCLVRECYVAPSIYAGSLEQFS